ncbi:hypothetical protein K432DRAFT_400869 [Lepidopterella palustris CBS 459.81]|uniref:Uncharacterized protein n=1 Tax=Lepidopterella palustris CBS 459.81 TaxID=1314670 RepID=A0A8E2EIP5_9PEZI|nr:hypothetical protein K432DRAFT_400869 [Lepidopterella palustris CBS 459.81]
MAQQQKIRRFIMTGSIAAITATGAWYGAELKTRQEFKQEKQKALEATPEEKIAQLEIARERLVSKRKEMERKIAAVTARRIAKEQKNREGS